jgi:prolipoprotein diacylglyceryltransferase
MVWHGGMSFHGGLLGVIIAAFIFAHSLNNKKNKEPNNLSKNWFVGGFKILDLMAVLGPIGLFF